LDIAIGKIDDDRATFGATINRLTYAVDNLTSVSQNTSASRSRILDTDYAKASSELARTQIIQQAATAILAQANQSQQSVLKLLG
jgi:flagellin